MRNSLILLFLLLPNVFICSIYLPKGKLIKFYSVSATIYNPKSNQCDASPLITADGSKINVKNANNLRWIAVSRDLLQDFNYGDTIIITNNKIFNGMWVIHDCMNKRFKKKIDFLQNRSGFYGAWKNVKFQKEIQWN